MNWLEKISQYNSTAAEIIPLVLTGEYDINKAIQDLQNDPSACMTVENMINSMKPNDLLSKLESALCGDLRPPQQMQQTQVPPFQKSYPYGTEFQGEANAQENT